MTILQDTLNSIARKKYIRQGYEAGYEAGYKAGYESGLASLRNTFRRAVSRRFKAWSKDLAAKVEHITDLAALEDLIDFTYAEASSLDEVYACVAELREQ